MMAMKSVCGWVGGTYFILSSTWNVA